MVVTAISRSTLRTIFALVLALGTAWAERRTLASLHNDSAPDIPAATLHVESLRQPSQVRPKALIETARGRAAARTLFVSGDPARAGRLATAAIRLQPRDAEALFVKMESAAMLADRDGMQETALRLCELAGTPMADPRVKLAAERLRESAQNGTSFRSLIPRLQAVIRNSGTGWPELSSALLAAAMDGAPSLQPASLAHGAGILTDWRIVGPLPRQVAVDVGNELQRGGNLITESQFGNHTVETFQFVDGRGVLPDYLHQHGTIYAASQFSVLEPGRWQLRLDSGTPSEVYLDGRIVAQTRIAWPATSLSVPLDPGPHRIFLKFGSAEGWWRISANPIIDSDGNPAIAGSAAEAAYWKAAGLYADANWPETVGGIKETSASQSSPALLFLLSQAQAYLDDKGSDVISDWEQLALRMPSALAAEEALAVHAARQGNRAEAILRASRVLAGQPQDENALQVLTQFGTPEQRESSLQQRVRLHPSCSVLLEAREHYQSEDDSAGVALSDIALDGCAPGSIVHARLLSVAGLHAAAAEALQGVLRGTPSDRAAMGMLVRELQLAGDDAGAQRAAADWIRIAPNANTYRRLAASYAEPDGPGGGSPSGVPFYVPFQRSVPQSTISSDAVSSDPVLLEDHVAVARPDGSVSLYVHRATRVASSDTMDLIRRETESPAEQLISLRLLKTTGRTIDLRIRKTGWNEAAAGDVIDQEFVLNFAGDGGIAEHPEVFQYVFAPSVTRVSQARFVVLTPASESDSGIVIATGSAPIMQSQVTGGVLARIWEMPNASYVTGSAAPHPSSNIGGVSFSVVRVVEKDNDWTTPRNAERRRRIETIHPGPKLADS